MAALRQLALYRSDDGNQYRVLIPVWLYNLTGAVVGFSADNSANAFLPRGTEKRFVTARDPVSLRHRKIHIGNIVASLWTTLSTGVTLPNIDGTVTDYTTAGRVGEKLRAP